MKLKRFLSVLIVISMIFGLTACGGNAGPVNNGKHDGEAQEKADDRGDEGRDENNNDVIEAVPDQTQDDPSPGNRSKNYEADWDGTWLPSERYSGVEKLVVEPSKDGVAFHLYYDGNVKDYSGKEEQVYYNDGSLTSATVISDDVRFDYTIRRYDGSSLITFYGDLNGNGRSGSYYFYRFTGNWKEAPAGYDDSDHYGILDRKDPDDSQYFYPDTDDYIIEYEEDSYISDVLKTYTNFPCELYTIYSFDENGEARNNKRKVVFENSEDASKLYSVLSSGLYGNSYYDYAISENIVYVTQAYSWTKLDLIYRTMYTGVNYIYTDIKGKNPFTGLPYIWYYYLSKPVSTDLFNLSLDDIVYYNKVYGKHYSTDNKDVWIDIKFDRGRLAFDFNSPDYKVSDMNMVKVDGLKIYTLTRSSSQNLVIFQVYEFGPEEAVITRYQYCVDDVENSGLTLDNFMSTTPDKTVTYTIDMTSKNDN